MTDTMPAMQLLDSSVVKVYRDEAVRLLQLSFPTLTKLEIATAVDYAIVETAHNPKVELENNYTKTKQETYLIQLVQYLDDRKPIFTASGCMFKHHGSIKNPLYDLIQSFLDKRKEYKKKMKMYPKGSIDFAKFNLFQLIEKRSANALYGITGAYSSVFYNYFIANGITSQGRDAIASAIMMFEEFLSNNVKFGSLNEMVHFIRCVLDDPRTMRDEDVLIAEDITIEECFFQIVATCGFYYVPSEEDMQIVWDMLTQVSQEDLNRLFYRNNLYWFCERSKVMDIIKRILSKLDVVFIDPNKVPECIEEDMDELYAILKEYVYHPHIIIDTTDRARIMMRDVSILTDTDSSFVSLEGWYKFIDYHTMNMDFPLRHVRTSKDATADNVKEKTEKELFPVSHFDPTVPVFDPHLGYDFDANDIIFKEEVIDCNTMCSDAGVKFTITNIMGNILYRLQVEYMRLYCKQYNTWDIDFDRDCLIVLKNEFALKNALITTASKNYATYQERQEENLVPLNAALDVKGLPITKAGVADRTKDQVKSILFTEVLNPDKIDQVSIVEKLSIMEKQIYDSLHSGEKLYYKPARIKALNSYANPTFAVVSADAYNSIKQDTDPGIDLTERNTICVINTDITLKNIETIKEEFPDVYERISAYIKMLAEQKTMIIENEDGTTTTISKKPADKIHISYIGIPMDANVPEWLKPFIDYIKIINDNIDKFPMEEVGIMRQGHNNLNVTNMLTF